MIRVTIMVWFELENGDPRFKTWDDHMHPCDAQYVATQLAIRYRNGSCKIFDTMDRVVGTAGFE